MRAASSLKRSVVEHPHSCVLQHTWLLLRVAVVAMQQGGGRAQGMHARGAATHWGASPMAAGVCQACEDPRFKKKCNGTSIWSAQPVTLHASILEGIIHGG